MPRHRLVRIVLLVSLLGLVGAEPTTSQSVKEISGTYAAHGVGVENREYNATVTIIKNDQTYLVQWKFTDGAYDGVGLREGDTLSVGWSNGRKAGVVVYKVNGKSLEGHWADGTENGKVYTETLTRK